MKCPICYRSSHLCHRSLFAGLDLIKAPFYILIKGFKVQSNKAMLHQMVQMATSPVLALWHERQSGDSSSDEPSEHPLTCRRWSRPCSCIVLALLIKLKDIIIAVTLIDLIKRYTLKHTYRHLLTRNIGKILVCTEKSTYSSSPSSCTAMVGDR